jgi:[ribosomal protein S5]-alanine N-acetyltransferase
LARIEIPVEGLSDGVIRLRPIADADIPEIVAAVQDPDIPRFTTVPEPYGEQEARLWQRTAAAGLRAGTDLALVVADAADGALLGSVGLHNLDPESGRCSAGYWIAARARGQGLARRALALLCGFAFAELGVARIEVWVEPVNAASLRVAEAVGFRREGLLRSFMRVGGERRDMLMYSLLPQDLG